MDVPFLKPSKIREAARALRQQAFGDASPVPVDLESLIYDYLYEEHSVAFYDDKLLGNKDEDDILGKTNIKEEAIYVDRRLAEEGHTGRYRFTLAHEIGHWCLHRPEALRQLEDGDTDIESFVTLERDIVESQNNDDSYRPEEWQANAFAIWLLLPDDLLEREFLDRFDSYPFECPSTYREPNRQESLRAGSRTLAATPKDGRPPLHEHFQLSIEATAIALEERGYIE